MTSKNNSQPCSHGSDDGVNKAEYLELDESAAEYQVEETNAKETE